MTENLVLIQAHLVAVEMDSFGFHWLGGTVAQNENLVDVAQSLLISRRTFGVCHGGEGSFRAKQTRNVARGCQHCLNRHIHWGLFRDTSSEPLENRTPSVVKTTCQ